MTDKNTIKSWFQNGAKPTQEQFWEWQESYWHKSETISQSQIDGLDKTLSNKAETSDLEAKANANASGLTDENKQAWKTALGVGELPTNIATIDEGDKTGSVYTKEQIIEKLENSGKNIGNTDLALPTGTVRTLDTTGAKLQIAGLEDKSNDASYNTQVIMNKQGELAKAPYIMKYQFAASSININHVVPPNLQPRPTFAQEVEAILTNFRTYQMQEVTLADFITEENAKVSPFSLDATTDFIIEIQTLELQRKNEFVGLSRSVSVEYGVFARPENSGYGASWHIKSGKELWLSYDARNSGPPVDIILIIKTKGVITVGGVVNNKMTYQSFNANGELGNYKIIFHKDKAPHKIRMKNL